MRKLSSMTMSPLQCWALKVIKFVSESMRRVRSRYTEKKSISEYSRNAQPIEPRLQRFYIKRINYRLTIDQVVAPIAFIFALQDRSELVRPEIDFNS